MCRRGAEGLAAAVDVVRSEPCPRPRRYTRSRFFASYEDVKHVDAARHYVRGARGREHRLRASRVRKHRPHEDRHARGHAHGRGLRESARVPVLRHGRRRRQTIEDALRDAGGHGVAPFGMVARNVRRGKTRDGHGAPASPGCVHLLRRGFDDRRRAEARQISAADVGERADRFESARAIAERRTEHLRRLGAGAIPDRAPPNRARRARAEEQGRGRRGGHGAGRRFAEQRLGRAARDIHARGAGGCRRPQEAQARRQYPSAV